MAREGDRQMNTLNPTRRERQMLLYRLAYEHDALSQELDCCKSYYRQKQILAEMIANETATYQLLHGGTE